MNQKQLVRHATSELICKLCDIIKKYPHIINWNSQGSKIIVFNVQQMQNVVLPEYFRHRNFLSFIRQLNMYDFHKLQKNQKYQNDFITFQHNIFKKGNQRNYHFIQRKKRLKLTEYSKHMFEKKNQSLLQTLRQHDKLSQTTKTSIQSLLDYKFVSTQNFNIIQVSLQNLNQKLKQCRSKKIKQALSDINDKIIEQIQQSLKISKNIDRIISSSFLNNKKQKLNQLNYTNINTNINLDNNIKTNLNTYKINPIFSSMFTELPYSNSLIGMPNSFGFFTFHDVTNSHPIFYSNPQFTYESSDEKKCFHQKSIDNSYKSENESIEFLQQCQVSLILDKDANKSVDRETDKVRRENLYKISSRDYDKILSEDRDVKSVDSSQKWDSQVQQKQEKQKEKSDSEVQQPSRKPIKSQQEYSQQSNIQKQQEKF